MMSVGNIGAGYLGEEADDFGRIRAAPDGVFDPPVIRYLRLWFYGQFNFIHLGGQFRQVGISGEHGPSECA